MVRHTDADARTDFEKITSAADVVEGATITVDGPDFLPASDLEVVDVDPEWSDETDGTVFVAKIPDRKGARDYTFRVYRNKVETTASGGRFGPLVTARVDPETLPDEDETSDKAIDADDVAFDAHAIAAAWEAADDLPVCVAVAVANEFTDVDVRAADGKKSDRDVVFGTHDDRPADVLVEEKTVGVCARETAEKYAPAYVTLPNRDDGKVLAVSPGMVFDQR